MITQGHVVEQRKRLKRILELPSLTDEQRQIAQARLDKLDAMTIQDFAQLPANRAESRRRFRRGAPRSARKQVFGT